MKKVVGVCPPVITLFNQDGSIDYEANKKQADFLIDKGVDGLAYLGTSGEFPVLTLEEKKEFLGEMTRYVNHRVNVIAGIGGTCLKETVELLHFADSAGADACLLINPYFSVYEDAMVEAYYDFVASSTETPIIIYNFPDLTGFDFSPELVRRLVRKNKNIVGIKDTVGDSSHLAGMIKIKEINPDFTVFCAYENQAFGCMVNGVGGFINATVNFAPEFTVGLYRSFRQGDLVKAAGYFEKMCDAMDIYRFSKPLFLACKQAAYIRTIGHDGGERLPALPLDAGVKKQIADKLTNLGLLEIK